MAASGSGEKLKHAWYQTEVDVVVTVLRKGVSPDACVVDFGDGKRLEVRVTVPDSSPLVLEVPLAHPIDPSRSSFKCTPSKIEIKMRKVEGGHWGSLEKKEENGAEAKPPAKTIKDTEVAAASSEADKEKEAQRTYPTSFPKGPKNWDRIEKEVKEEEEKEEVEGDAAVNRLFQKIYKDSSDEVRKAMMKSFTESNGTCLSTNWEEVQKGKVECKPPEGMEWKKYDK